jgi:AraC-like DNA-binding protein/quercetin dioxygenase-like cupin family protein
MGSLSEVAAVLGRTVFAQQIDGVVISQTAYEPSMLMAEHVHERAYVTFVTEGRYTEHTREMPRHLRRSMFVFHPAGETHADCVHDQSMTTVNVEYLSGDLPREFFSAEGREVDALARGFLTALPGSGRALRDAIAAIGAFVRLRLQRAEPCEQMLQARRTLRETERPAAVTALASELGMHRVQLHRAFKRAYGDSLRDEVSKNRLSDAARLLTTSEESVAGIAAACGYFDQSHFCRQFKRFGGMSPSGYRRAFRTG